MDQVKLPKQEARSCNLTDLEAVDAALVEEAQRAARNAYAPYSGFAVGAAVRTRSGNLYTGANLENASYGVTMCAEVAALMAANSAGDFDIVALAVAGLKFREPCEHELIVTPCGRCRQLISEASQIAGIDIPVFCCSGALRDIRILRISELLPAAFGPANLGLNSVWPAMQTELHNLIERLVRERTERPRRERLRGRRPQAVPPLSRAGRK